MSHQANVARIRAVANALQELKEKVVFVGGAAVSLYAERKGFEVRPTDDVDVIIEVLNYYDRNALEERLTSIGFSPDIESGIVCRYILHETTVVDVMPTNDPSIGFNNIWYPEGFTAAVEYNIG